MSDTTFLDRALESLTARRKGRRKLRTPSRRNQDIFRRVAAGGEAQQAVAGELELHPSTVCRIVEQVRRWLAAGSPGQPDALDPIQQRRLDRQLARERHLAIYERAMRRDARDEAKL